MANTGQNFTQIFLTYRDVKEANPNWSDKMIEDYLSLKRDLLLVSQETDMAIEDDTAVNPLAFALINELRRDVGSGDFLTSDETGFTVDTTNLTVDMTEA